MHLASHDGNSTTSHFVQQNRRSTTSTNLFDACIGLGLAGFVERSHSSVTADLGGKAVQELIRYLNARYPCRSQIGSDRSDWDDVGVILEQIHPLAGSVGEITEAAHTIRMLVQTFVRARPSGGGEMVKSMTSLLVLGSTPITFLFVDQVLVLEALSGPHNWKAAFAITVDGCRRAGPMFSRAA